MIIESQHYKPGKGGAFVRTKLRNVKLGTVVDRTFRSGETVEGAFIEEGKYQYLYYSDGQYHFMDNSTYEQIALPQEKIGDAKMFLKENTNVSILSSGGEVLSVKLPIFIDLKIVQTEPGVRGDTAKAGTKSATLETGATVQVPLFINQGETVKIDTRTGTYVGRA
jgi:elongation factor P